MKKKSLPPGVRLHGLGFQATVKVRGERSYAQFPLTTLISEIQEWQQDERAHLRTITMGRPAAGTFAADAKKYLALSSVKAMPTYTERVQHIEEWVAVFGERRRRKITPLDIEAQRDHWFTTPRGKDADGNDRPPYSAAAVNKRLRALSNLWTKLDGRRAPNPVLEIEECEEPDPQARGLSYDVVEAILDAMPGYRRKLTPAQAIEVRTAATAPGANKSAIARAFGISETLVREIVAGRGAVSTETGLQTKARLRVIAYTGLAHKQLATLTRDDVDLEAATLRLTARKKGRRIRRAQDKALPELLPLIPEAVAAFREFDRLKCWGPFSHSAMWKAFQRACKTLDLEGLTPYDFRHSFLSMVYAETRDLRVTGKFGGHRSERTTRRYTIAAVAPHVAAAAEKVRARLASSAGVRR